MHELGGWIRDLSSARATLAPGDTDANADIRRAIDLLDPG
jgi:hypothetical protein